MSHARFPLPPHLCDAHLAPGFSEFSGVVLEDLSAVHPEQRHWLFNYVLNQLTHSVKPKYRELAFNHLRRAQGALDAYHQLRRLLGEYGAPGKRARSYFPALDQAEICVSFAAQAFELSNKLLLLSGDTPVYQHASEQELTTLRSFYIACKHVANMLDGSQFEAPDTVVFWFTQEGLQSRKRGVLTYQSLANVLRELAYDASVLASYISPVPESGT
ncbi:hypothetical protein [Ideonella sp. BN130291]|uniref:hypothetical protein n=1 Tax=Ideonella sp. BN130291 TaxID=3112940 RepID=UPI002E264308|nr:hypothetical protein [Ideonella sp. BN130291]